MDNDYLDEIIYLYKTKVESLTYDNLTETSKKLQDEHEDICCHICCHIIIYPIEHNLCGKILCGKCYDKCIDTNTCPFCKQNMNYNNSYYTKRLEQKIKNVKVICPNNECTKELEYGKLFGHLQDECLFETIECDNCDDIMFRYDYKKHTEELCKNRKITCEYCKLDFLHNIIKEHECEYKPFECQNGCKTIVNKNILENHNNNCPEKIISCPIKNFTGCTFQCKLKDIQNHMLDIQTHFMGSLKEIQKMREENKELKIEKELTIQAVTQINDDLKKSNVQIKKMTDDIKIYNDNEYNTNNILKKYKNLLNEIKEEVDKTKNFGIVSKKLRDLVKKVN
jgi:hypothetical protein